MSSSYKKLEKRAQEYKIKEFYKNMSPEDYQYGIESAIKKTEESLAKQYNDKYQKLTESFKSELKDGIKMAIDTISVELLYELANQMDVFTEEDEYLLNQKIDKVQEIYINTMETIKKYNNYKNNNQAHREFERKKKKVEKLFSIEF